MTGKLKRDNRTWAALVVTAEGERLDGMDDRTVYLPLSQLKFTENYNHEVIIHCPEWLIKKNSLNWHRISEIEAID